MSPSMLKDTNLPRKFDNSGFVMPAVKLSLDRARASIAERAEAAEAGEQT